MARLLCIGGFYEMENEKQHAQLMGDAALANKLNVIYHAYVDISGDLIAGALLGQVLYWFSAGKDGRPRARIVKENKLWIAKTRSDWWDEIRISPKQYDRAAKILKDKGFIEIKTFKFNGNPTTHICINAEKVNIALEAWKLEQVKPLLPNGEEGAAVGFNPLGNNDIPETANPNLPEGEAGNSPNGNNDFVVPDISITETTVETTKENMKENTHTLTAPPSVSAPNALQSHLETKEYIALEFEKVWSEYPKKEGKQKARQAFEKAIRGMGTRKPNGLPYTAAEILAETILYRQHVERRLERGDLERRYIPSGGAWFEREGWADEVPSISSTFDDMLEGMDYNRNAADLRRCAALIDKAPEPERVGLLHRLQQIRAALPY